MPLHLTTYHFRPGQPYHARTLLATHAAVAAAHGCLEPECWLDPGRDACLVLTRCATHSVATGLTTALRERAQQVLTLELLEWPPQMQVFERVERDGVDCPAVDNSAVESNMTSDRVAS